MQLNVMESSVAELGVTQSKSNKIGAHLLAQWNKR